MRKILISLLFLPFAANAQTISGVFTEQSDGFTRSESAANVADFVEDELDIGATDQTVTGDFDFGGGTLQVPNSTSLPGTCEVGDAYMDTDATSGERFYLCESANTWALQGDGGGGGGGSMDDFSVTGDSGTPETIADGNTLDIAGGAGIDTSVAATDTVTVAIDSTVATLTGSQILTNKTIDADNNSASNFDIGNEVDWAASGDVSTASAFTSGDFVLVFEDGVGMRKVDHDSLPGVGVTDTSADTECSGTDTYLDGEGNCDNFSSGTFGDGLDFSASTVTIDLVDDGDGTTATTSSESGLEFDGGELSLLRGCSDNQILKWDSTAEDWSCEADSGAAGGDSWGDAVDADIVPDGDGTRDLGATATRFAETYTDTIDVTEHVQIDPSSSQTYSEGLIYYDDEDKTVNYFNDESDVTVNLGRESLVRVYNDTGSTINQGDAVSISGYDATSDLPEVTLTDTSSSDGVRFAGLATHDIEDATAGYITNFGRVSGLNTSSFTAGVTLYLSGDDGSLTETRPDAPEYVMPIGVTVESHASTGSIFVGATSIHGGNARLTENVWNGVTVENTDIDVSSNGTTITFTLEADGGGDLTLLMDEARQTLDCTPACSVTLTEGTDTAPQLNYIYVPASTDVLTNSTSGFPTAQHVPVATVLAQSAASMQTDEPYKVHAWQDATQDSNSQGRLSLINRWIRQQNATWSSGVAVTPSVGASTFDVATSAGVVYQMNRHSFPAFDTSGGDVVYVVNDPDAAYTQVGDLTLSGGVDKDANGVTLGGSATDFYNLVLWGVVSEDDDQSKLMLNLPTEAYGNDNGDQASNDDNNTAVYTIPQEYKGTGFLIARLTVRENGGTYTIENNVDLRGQVPGLQGGQGAFGGSEFADNVFRIQDDGDDTKEVAFQVSGITTGTTRTITVPDSDLDLANLPTSAEKTVLGNTSGTNTGDESSATTSAEGIVELATTAETTTGTDTGRAVTPDALADSTFTDSVYWPGGSLIADGTQCADPAKTTINSGPIVYAVICTDNDASIVYGDVAMPDGYDGGTVTFELQALNTAADTNTLDMDFSAQCRGDSDAVNSTWGTEVAGAITFTTANDIEHVTTAAVTPNGTCAAGDTLYWRAAMDATATTTAVATTLILGVKMEYTTTRGD